MKQYNIILIALVCALFACSEMNDLHQKYLDEGEEIYPARIDTVLTFPGDHRIMLKNVIKVDPNITSCKIYWDNKSDSIELPVERTSGIDTISTMLTDLIEGSYVFDVYTFDAEGNRSVKLERSAKVYGDKYKRSLTNRRVSGISSTVPGIAVIEWKESESGEVNTTLKYQSVNGSEVEVIVNPDETETVLDDFQYGGEITYHSTYKPLENAIDVFDAADGKLQLPADFLVDKAGFEFASLPTDHIGGCWGGSIDKLWNNSTAGGDYYHSGCYENGTDGIPHHLTINLGASVGLTRVKLNPRTDCCQGRNPKHIQIWGIDDITDAETTLLSTDANWEEESVSKGWVKLLDVETPSHWNGSSDAIVLDIPDNVSVKYIRYRCLSTWNDQPYSALSEMTFWADRLD
ncbi:hypothetical protein EYV94_09790 [Puteibacter caeruleilacunae]|nr:hypothetical protein EYV94_09790 [Puteibacter caeruleilacunae]